MLSKWFWLILGIFIGWLAGWLIEIFYWRGQRRQRYQARIQELQGTLDAYDAQAREMRGDIELRDLRIAEMERKSGATAELPVGEEPEVEAAAPTSIPAQNLSAIRGIGPVFQQRFYETGIGTYAELAALSDAQVEIIIQPKPWQEFNYESWNEQARRLAEETDTVGAVWNGIVPDDLSEIRGIGQVFKQKLYDAGIMTFADLATKTPAELKAIIRPEGWQAVNFADWIAQARELA